MYHNKVLIIFVALLYHNNTTIHSFILVLLKICKSEMEVLVKYIISNQRFYSHIYLIKYVLEHSKVLCSFLFTHN